MMMYQEVKKSVAAKLKRANEIIDEVDEQLDETIHESPQDKEVLQLKELREALFGVHEYREQPKGTTHTTDEPCTLRREMEAIKQMTTK